MHDLTQPKPIQLNLVFSISFPKLSVTSESSLHNESVTDIHRYSYL